MTEEQVAILRALQELLGQLGSANDAESHGHGEQAAAMRQAATEAIRGLLDGHPFVDEVLPQLRARLASGGLGSFGWYEQSIVLEALLRGRAGGA